MNRALRYGSLLGAEGGDIAADRGHQQVVARAGGAVGDFAVAVDVLVAEIELLTQDGDQLVQRCELCGGGALVFEVADQADADAVLVEEVIGAPVPKVAAGVGFAVRAGLLTFPAGAHVEFSVWICLAVADHEVVAEAMLPFAVAEVVAVHALRAGVGSGGVVNDDEFPLAVVDAAGDLNVVGLDGGESGGWVYGFLWGGSLEAYGARDGADRLGGARLQDGRGGRAELDGVRRNAFAAGGEG